ncbi:MAG: glycerophosphodiester phosphodiesterase [Dehalococcoidia bacterium]
MSPYNIYSLVSESRPLIIAKYGNSSNFPENTYISLESAMDNYADVIEITLQMSSDGYLVVFNDVYLENKSDGHGLVQSQSLDYLKNLDIGSWYSKEFKNQRIVTFPELLKLINTSIILSIKIKPHQKPGIEASIENTLIQFNSINIHEIFSSEYTYLEKLSQRNKNIVLGYEFNKGETKQSLTFMNTINSNIAHVNFKDITDRLIRYFHSEEKILIVDTNNGTQLNQKLIQLGVDCIATNDPYNLYKMINK